MGELILTRARALFLSYGFRSVSMDDLARLAGISKKTIYHYYADKNALIDKVVENLIACHHQLFTQCAAEAKDAIDEVLKQSRAPFDTWASLHPGFFYELEKFFPESWKKLELHKQTTILPGIIKNIERGTNEHSYRADIQVAFTAEIRINQLKDALQPQNFTHRKINVSALIHELTLFYLHAITTEKGKKLLCNYTTNTNENETHE